MTLLAHSLNKRKDAHGAEGNELRKGKEGTTTLYSPTSVGAVLASAPSAYLITQVARQ